MTFPVSEVKEACRILSDFVKNDDCEGGSLFKRSKKMTLFDEKRVLTVGIKLRKLKNVITLWVGQNLILFVVVFDLTCMT